MFIETTKDLEFTDCSIPKGHQTLVLTQPDFEKLKRGEEKKAIERARHNYKKRGIEGVFIHYNGIYRWLPHTDYKRITWTEPLSRKSSI